MQVVGTRSGRAREIPMAGRVREILQRLDAANGAGHVVSLDVCGPAADMLKLVQAAGKRAGIRGPPSTG